MTELETTSETCLYVDNSTLSTYAKCPRQAYWRYEESLVPRFGKTYFAAGTIVHEGIFAYYASLAAGNSHETATLAATRRALELLVDYECAGEKARNKTNVLKAVVWYCFEYENDPITQFTEAQTPALELPFKYEIRPGLIICGRIDRAGYHNNLLTIIDHKTTTRELDDKYFSEFASGSQPRHYFIGCLICFSAKPTQFIINAVRFGKFPEFARRILPINEETAEEYFATLSHIAEAWAASKANGFWPEYGRLNSECNSFRGRCAYYELCHAASSTLQENCKKSLFKVEPWNPGAEGE